MAEFLAAAQLEHASRASGPAATAPAIAAAPDARRLAELRGECDARIRRGSKSFALAARLFGPRAREAAAFVYGWCRHCDDAIDAAPDAASAVARLAELRRATESVFAGEPQADIVFEAFQAVVHRHGIPRTYAFDLLDGMEMDTRRESYATIEDLRLYGYRVAGTVGLMMTHAMGVSDERALHHAVDLGIAMQLTNIARDVLDDAALGRVYLPLEWLDEEGVPAARVADPRLRAPVARVVARLLAEADRHYASGAAGLRYLPFRAALAVASAAGVYSEIGRRVLARGPRAWDERVWVPLPAKLRVIAGTVARVIATLPGRTIRPFSPVTISTVWRSS